jgi:hypothetical protein
MFTVQVVATITMNHKLRPSEMVQKLVATILVLVAARKNSKSAAVNKFSLYRVQFSINKKARA